MERVTLAGADLAANLWGPRPSPYTPLVALRALPEITSARPAVCYNPTRAHSAYKASGAAGISAGALQQQIDLFHRIAEDGQTELAAAN